MQHSTMISQAQDPRPEPPEKPLPSDCCGSGCAVCVLDVYADALERYEQALADWLRRHPQGGPAR
jgi:hypothetical protein